MCKSKLETQFGAQKLVTLQRHTLREYRCVRFRSNHLSGMIMKTLRLFFPFHLATLLVLQFPRYGALTGADAIERRSILGGWGSADVADERVVGAGQFALSALRYPPPPTAESRQEQRNSPGVAHYSFLSALYVWEGVEFEEHVKPVVVLAEEQVVAGMNYRMTIAAAVFGTDCLGAFEATVYDHFGERSVIYWGPEIACDGNVEEAIRAVANDRMDWEDEEDEDVYAEQIWGLDGENQDRGERDEKLNEFKDEVAEPTGEEKDADS